MDNYNDFPLFVNYSWNKWRFFAVLSDFILFHTKGDIVEIGIGITSTFFTVLSKKYKRKIYHCDTDKVKVEQYLLKNIDCNSVFLGFSDDFFKKVKLTPIALGFIDGDHMYEQAKRDFDNLFPYVVDDGFIFIHDTYPPTEDQLAKQACGTSYLLRQKLEKDSRVDCFTFTKSAFNVGLTMARKKSKDLPFYQL